MGRRVKTNEAWQRPFLEGDLNQLAQLGMNPATGYLIPTEFAALNLGGWVISTAASSAVGTFDIPVVKTRRQDSERVELVIVIAAVGSDAVLVDGPNLTQQIGAAIDNKLISIALDGADGPTAKRLFESIGPYGKVVL